MLYVTNFKENIPENSIAINTTSKSNNWTKGLSPFILKPYCVPNCNNIENLWQYSKVYKEHLDENGNPSNEWFIWRNKGFSKKKAVRYPMGKNIKPEYSY